MREIILTSSVLILVTALLRWALRGRVSPCILYALWLLAAARLLIPGTLFDAPVSVVGAAAEFQSAFRQTVPGPYTPDSSAAADPTPPPDGGIPSTHSSGAVTGITTDRHPEFDMQDLPRQNWPDIVWKAGMAVTGGALALSNLAFYLRLRKSRKRLALPAAPWFGALPVYEAAGLPSPCLFGLFRPAVYLNGAAMNAPHPEHILAHEYAHYRHGDHLWAVLRCVCLAVHWYNPLVWWAAELSRRDCELACDAAALRRLGEEERIDYGQTLLAMVSKRPSPAALLHTATTMTAGKRAMKERISLIVRQPRTRKLTLALVALLACGLAACSFGGKAEEAPPSEPPGISAPEAPPENPENPDIAQDPSAENARSVVEQIQQGADAGGWLPLMSYMDWADIRQAAVEAGLDEAETEQQVVDAVWQYIGRQDTALTRGEYLSILTATEGLTGTPKEGDYHSRSDNVFPTRYGDIVYRLYNINPGMFAYVLLNELPEPQQSEVLDFFRYEGRDWIEWDRGEYPDFNQAPSREEAVAQLERDLERGVSAAPSEMTLSSAGESFQFLPVNAYGVYAASYTSSDPSVAEVDETGVVTAVGSGEADITMHFEGMQSQQDFVCHVRCELEGGPEAAAKSIRSYVSGGVSPREWIPLLGRTSWRSIAALPVLPESELKDGIMDVQEAIYRYIISDDTSLTDGEFLTLMSATAGLDGAYAEGYASILYTLYNLDPARFAAIALDDLTPEQRDETVGLLLYEWGYFHRTEDGRPYQERLEELLARLEEDKKGELALSPDALIFFSVGEVRLIRVVNDMSALSYLSWESADPEVVTVKLREDNRFELQAVSPGEAVITVRCSIGGEERTLTCSVLCSW